GSLLGAFGNSFTLKGSRLNSLLTRY
ncbi:MAG: hypothetical protein ACI87A_003867, partial [Planctomycetota bacterium]